MSSIEKLAVILCLSSTTSLAQIAAKGSHLVPLEANCPIGVRAILEKSGNLVPAQRLEVALTKWPSFPIVASRVTVQGISLGVDRPEQSAITASLDLKRIVDYPRPTAVTTPAEQEPQGREGPLAELDDILGPPQPVVIIRDSSISRDSRWYAWVTGFAAVNFVDLESVSYADGTSWHAPNEKPCRVSVDSSVW